MPKLSAAQEKWLRALESRKYRQGRGFLWVKDRKGRMTYDCFGVACVELGIDTNKMEASELEPENSLGFLAPDEVVEVLELYDSTGKNISDDKLSVTILNDGDRQFGLRPHSHKQIAKIIRANPQHYFKNMS
ncbi:MAG: hypothetical protein AAF066_11240 [Pseudomonadota bacterium]